MIAKVHGRWAFVSRHTHRPLAYWHGAGRPTKEWEAEQERRVQYFKHLGEGGTEEPWDEPQGAAENPLGPRPPPHLISSESTLLLRAGWHEVLLDRVTLGAPLRPRALRQRSRRGGLRASDGSPRHAP